MYRNKDSCINDCEGKYINYNLIQANLKQEAKQFEMFIREIMEEEDIKVYIKGGNVLGLKILKMINFSISILIKKLK